MENWRELLKSWIEQHGGEKPSYRPTPNDYIPIWWDTSGSVDMTEFYREEKRRQDHMEHVDRTIAKWKGA